MIEFDGEQHFKPTDFTSKQDILTINKSFISLKNRDQIKTTYCKKNNIKLIRIPYWKQHKISNILLKELTQLGLVV